jgi:hypothetical protein
MEIEDWGHEESLDTATDEPTPARDTSSKKNRQCKS